MKSLKIIAIVVLVPLTHAWWERSGMASFWVLAGAAVLVDLAFFVGEVRWLGWSNYLFVWGAVHQLGYAWRDGHFADPRRTLVWAAGGLVVFLALIFLGPYPVSMVGVPGDSISNTTPPKITLIALGVLQTGLLLSVQAPARRWLARSGAWTATVLVNGMIMTVFLWHLTVMVLVIGLAHGLGGVGLGFEPGSGAWWSFRPVWLAGLMLTLLPFVAAFSRFERPASGDGMRAAAAWRLVLGSLIVCAGLALLALDGIGGTGWSGLRLWVLALPFGGALLLRGSAAPVRA